MFVLMSSRSSSKLGHLVSKTRSPGEISRKLCYNHFELWSECLPWSVLDLALKVLCCSGDHGPLVFFFFFFIYFCNTMRKSFLSLCVEKDLSVTLSIYLRHGMRKLLSWPMRRERPVVWAFNVYVTGKEKTVFWSYANRERPFGKTVYIYLRHAMRIIFPGPVRRENP